MNHGKDQPKVFVVYKGVIIDQNKDPQIRRQIEVRPFKDDLHYLQELVGGYLEHFTIDEDLDRLHIDMWIDEEGKLKSDKVPTIALTHEGHLYDVIMGNCVFSKYDDTGETLGLSLDEMNLVIGWLHDHDIVQLVSKDGRTDIPVLAVGD